MGVGQSGGGGGGGAEEQNAYAFCMKNSVNGEPIYLYLYALCGSCEDDERVT